MGPMKKHSPSKLMAALLALLLSVFCLAIVGCDGLHLHGKDGTNVTIGGGQGVSVQTPDGTNVNVGGGQGVNVQSGDTNVTVGNGQVVNVQTTDTNVTVNGQGVSVVDGNESTNVTVGNGGINIDTNNGTVTVNGDGVSVKPNGGSDTNTTPATNATASNGNASKPAVSDPAPSSKLTVTEDGHYTSKEEVALYIHTFGHLPGNYITKKDAKAAGWVASKGNLAQVCPGMSIGGDTFGNREGLLPKAKGRTYKECDINYVQGKRNAERIVFSNDGLVFYTNDHYQTFEQLY